MTGQKMATPVGPGALRNIAMKLAGEPRAEIVILALLMAVFAVCAGYFAFHLKQGIVPDETSHFYISSLFTANWGFPELTERAFVFGLKQFDRQPYLFYWINGRLLFLLNLVMPGVSEWRQLLFLRVTSVVFSTLTLLYVYLLAKETLNKRWWPLLAVFLTSNTLMFAFLSGGVSYDNLTNLCATAGIYHLVKTLRGKKVLTNSLLWVLFIGLGAIVKKTILPLALVMFVIWMVYLIRNRRTLLIHSEMNWRVISVGVLTLAVVGLNLAIYGVNLVKYQQLIPECRVLHTPAQCELSVFRQRAEEMDFPEEKLALQDVIAQKKPGPVNYFLEFWLKSMQTGTFGIIGHQVFFPIYLDAFITLFFLFVLLAAVRYWGKSDWAFYTLLILVGAYFATILNLNYDKELNSNFRHVALQGRYLFPVLAPFYVLVVEFVSRVSHAVVRKLLVAYSIIVFAVGGPAYFLLIVAARNQLDWFV